MSVNGCANKLCYVLVDENYVDIIPSDEFLQTILNVTDGSICNKGALNSNLNSVVFEGQAHFYRRRGSLAVCFC